MHNKQEPACYVHPNRGISALVIHLGVGKANQRVEKDVASRLERESMLGLIERRLAAVPYEALAVPGKVNVDTYRYTRPVF
jgi:hypothetical protein